MPGARRLKSNEITASARFEGPSLLIFASIPIVLLKMRSTVLELSMILSLFGTGASFLKTTPIRSSRASVKSFVSMAAASSCMGGISYRVSNLQQSVDFYTNVFGMKLVESDAAGAKLMMDTTEDGQAAMTLELLGGFVRDSSEMGDVSINSFSQQKHYRSRSYLLNHFQL